MVEVCESDVAFHGALGLGRSWALPKLTAESDAEARPGYEAFSASEYLDSPAVLKEKVTLLAALVQEGARTVTGGVVLYSGAGLSTAAGIPDYASKAGNSQAPHLKALSPGSRPSKTGRLGGLASLGTTNRLELQATFSHHAIAALEHRGFVQHWLQQNHDRLAQKAGFPQPKLNEIHGAWGDLKNPVLMMDDALRPDLLQWLSHWAQQGSLVLAVGTSLCGMTSDSVAEAAAARGGLVIVNLQRTRLDDVSALRIWALADDVFALLAKELGIKVPDPEVRRRGDSWVAQHPGCKYSTARRTAKDPL